MKEKFLANALYLHFPFCRHLCNYCDFFKRVPQNREEVSGFESLLERQFQSLSRILVQNNYEIAPLKTLYFGGGTPSLWGSDGALFWSRFIEKNKINFDHDYEFTMELNPGSWKTDDLKSWQDQGLNRISMGMQSIDDRFIKILDRVHDRAEALRTLKMLKQSKINYSVDFILGLPHSHAWKRDIEKELEEVLQYEPKHLSLYILTVKSNYVHIDQLPQEEYIEEEFLKVSEILKRNGFHHYEVSNFAREGFESQHNLRYWKQETTLALGPSATGYLAEAQMRFKWKEDETPSIENLSSDEIFMEKAFLSLRTSKGLDANLFCEDQRAKVVSVFSLWQTRGLGNLEGSIFRPGAKGFLLMDSLLGELMSAKLL